LINSYIIQDNLRTKKRQLSFVLKYASPEMWLIEGDIIPR